MRLAFEITENERCAIAAGKPLHFLVEHFMPVHASFMAVACNCRLDAFLIDDAVSLRPGQRPQSDAIGYLMQPAAECLSPCNGPGLADQRQKSSLESILNVLFP